MEKVRLTAKIAKKYYERAIHLPDEGGQDIGERRRLKEELMEEVDVTEIEAINIISGFATSDYVNKYDSNRIKADRENMDSNRYLLEAIADIESRLCDMEEVEKDERF